jgi:putative nucleotidyltransferase with HDIG domain
MSDQVLDGDEVYRRMPALHLVDDVELREQTARLTAAAPPYFWRVPASTSGYHHPLCQGEHGLWAHTLMVSTVLERLADSFVQQGLIEQRDVDLARSAAIIHDQRKNGPAEAPSTSSVSNHDVLMANVIESEGLPSGVADAVRAHMGPWYDGPSPSTPLEDLVHTADMVASTATITPKVANPIPEEIADLGAEGADL